MNTTKKISVWVAGFCLALFIPQLALATSYTVSTTTDELDGSPQCITGSSTDCSLREAVRAANQNADSDSTIIIPAGTYTLTLDSDYGSGFYDNDDHIDGDLDFSNDVRTVTLQGAGVSSTIIDGNAAVMHERIMDVQSDATVVVENLSLDGAMEDTLDSDDGGAIYNAGDLTLTAVAVTNNSTGLLDDAYGGAIYNAAGASLVIDSSDISGNISQMHAGGIYIDAGSTATITNSSVASNQAQHADHFERGGGIYNNGTLTIDRSQITENSVTADDNNAYGGGIFNYSNSSLTLTNSTVGANTAVGNTDSFGGGIYGYDETAVMTLQFVTIANNQAKFGAGAYGTTTMTGTIIANNTNINDGTDPDCYGTLTANSYNIIGNVTSNCTIENLDLATNSINTDPDLTVSMQSDATLNYYGFNSAATSPAVNSIPAATCSEILGGTVVDQLNNPRVGYCDIGAFEYQDTTLPVITVTDDTITANTVECSDTYTDAGATATDDIDETLTDAVETTNPVDTQTLGDYTVTYAVSDLSNNENTAARTVSVVDTTAPQLTLTGEDAVSVYLNDTYTDEGATTSDVCDSTVSVVTTNPVDTSTPGTYTVTYTATDVSNNTGTATRTVTVLGATDDQRTAQEVTRDGSTLTITLSDATVVTIDPFNGSSNFQYAVSEDARRVIVTNGKVVRVYVAQNKVAQKKISRKVAKAKQYRLKVHKLFSASSYDDVIVLTSRKHKGKVHHLRVTSANTLTKLQHATLAITKAKPVQIRFLTKHRFQSRFGKGATATKNVWKVTKKGTLKAL